MPRLPPTPTGVRASKVLTDWLTNALVSFKVFNVVNRSKIQAALDEQKLADEKFTAQTGIKVNYIGNKEFEGSIAIRVGAGDAGRHQDRDVRRLVARVDAPGGREEVAVTAHREEQARFGHRHARQ